MKNTGSGSLESGRRIAIDGSGNENDTDERGRQVGRDGMWMDGGEALGLGEWGGFRPTPQCAPPFTCLAVHGIFFFWLVLCSLPARISWRWDFGRNRTPWAMQVASATLARTIPPRMPKSRGDCLSLKEEQEMTYRLPDGRPRRASFATREGFRTAHV